MTALTELGGNPATDKFAGFIYVGNKQEELTAQTSSKK